MASRVLLIFTTISLLLAAAISPILAEEESSSSNDIDAAVSNDIIGTATDIDYASGSFILVDGKDSYTILAQDAVVRFNANKVGRIGDLKNKSHIMVTGDRLSAKTIRARTITVFDETGDFKDLRTQGYHPNADVDIDGQVIRVNPGNKEFIVRAKSDIFTVVVGAVTEIKRSAFTTTIYDINEGDQVNVIGNMSASDTIAAIRVQINSAKVSYYPSYDSSYYSGYPVIQGTIVTPASLSRRSLVIYTTNGRMSVEVPRGAEVLRDGRSASIHDLIAGEWVRVYGSWDSNYFEAVRVESFGVSYRPNYDYGTKYDPRIQVSDHSQTRVGTITSVNSSKHELSLDVGLADMTINATDAKVQSKGASISFSSLEKGDKVQVTGVYSAGFLKADTVSLIAKAIDNKDKIKN